MPGVRDHEPVVIEEFNGLWARGDDESVPLDHFIQADNIQYFASGFETRNPINPYQTGGRQVTEKILRIYNYVMQTGQSLLVLVAGGKIYHLRGTGTLFGPILAIPEMEDFGFVSIAGRAYITPFKSYVDDHGLNQEKGLSNNFVYVYRGDGTQAKKIGGAAPSNGSLKQPTAYVSTAFGSVTKGLHYVMVSYNGSILGPRVAMTVDVPGDRMIQCKNVLPGPEPRVIYMTKTIDLETYANADTFYRVGDITPAGATDFLINAKDSELTVAFPGSAVPFPTNNAMTIDQHENVDGHCDIGYHIVGVVYETDTGYLTAPGPESFGQTTYMFPVDVVLVENIPIAPIGSYVVKRHLVSTKAIPYFDGDEHSYQFFFIPGGEIPDNTTTTKIVSYYDADLVDDASHLSDNFSEVKAGVAINTYHGRMVLVGEYDNPSLARISAPGDPESFNKVDGLITAPLDGNPLTNVQEFRDILYMFKKTRTYAYSDNSDEPVTWMPEEVIDEAIGAPVHGIATVLDSGGVNIDYLLIADLSGLMMFNGVYSRPELSWKIENYWFHLDRNEFRKIQIVNDSISKRIWICQPDPFRNRLLYADYGDGGLDAKGIKWSRWFFSSDVTSIALIEVSKLIVGISIR